MVTPDNKVTVGGLPAATIMNNIPFTIAGLNDLSDDPDPVSGHSTDSAALTANKKEDVKKQWDAIHLHPQLRSILGDKSFIERAKIYFRWLQNGRSLVAPAFFTKHVQVYKNLNILLTHVTPHPLLSR